MDRINKISFWLFVLIPSTLFIERTFSSILIILLALLNIKYIFNFNIFRTIYRNKILLFSLIYFIAHGLALLYTNDLDNGIENLGIIFSFIMIPILGVAIFKSSNKNIKIDNSSIEKLYLPFITVGVLCMLYCILNALYSVNFGNGSKSYWFFYKGLSSPLWEIQPMYLAYYYNFLLSILLFHQWKFKQSYLKILQWFLIVLTLVFLILLSARTPLIITGGIIIYYIYSKLIYKKYINLLIGGICVLLFIFIGMFKMDNRFQELFDENGAPSFPRMYTWKSALEVAQNNFFFGIPHGDLNEALIETYKKNNYVDGENFEYNCHNQYLQQMCYFGILGFGFLILWLYTVFRASLNLNVIFKILVISIILYLCTESLFLRNKGIIFVSYFFTLIALYDDRTKQRS